MIGVNFSKAKAQHFLDCLENGKPIRPQDPLALSGAALFGAALAQDGAGEVSDADLRAAAWWTATATKPVSEGVYSEHFDETHEAVVEADGGEVQILAGLK